MYSVLNDFPLCAPSCEMGLDEDDESVSWLNFPIAEPLNDECYSEFLPELGNESSKQKSSSHHVKELVHPSSAVNAMCKLQDSTSKVISGVTELKKHKTGDNSPLVWSQHLLLTGNSEITRSDSGNNLMDPRNSGDSFMGSKLNKLNAGQPMNFPHFSFASIPGATIAGAVTNGKQREFNKNRGGSINGHNPMEPILINCSHQEPDFLPPQESEAVCVKAGEDVISLDQPFDAVPPKIMVGVERIPEPAVTTSSVCSGNNRFERNSNDPACSLKRKCHETADSDSSNNEAEEESFSDGQSAFGCTDSKRSRVAKVHSLSERRRRERINEKMRALQELIPNYSKADKASMLDEAIEYLKAFQLQVQMLSMGSGMYTHPMMLPAAMQRMHRNHMPQLLPMGMGLGSAMSMQNLNYSMTQMPNIQGQQLFMSSMPCVPPPLCGSSPMGNISRMPGMFAVPLLAPSATPKEMMVQNVSSQMTNQNAQ